jgi:hypothetical protein
MFGSKVHMQKGLRWKQMSVLAIELGTSLRAPR